VLGLIDRLGQGGACVAAVVIALGACGIAASVMAPVGLGRLAGWVLAIGGLIGLAAGVVYLAVFYDRRDRPHG
jgi:hypothetical protein